MQTEVGRQFSGLRRTKIPVNAPWSLSPHPSPLLWGDGTRLSRLLRLVRINGANPLDRGRSRRFFRPNSRDRSISLRMNRPSGDMDCGGKTPLWLHGGLSKCNLKVWRVGKAESCLRSPNIIGSSSGAQIAAFRRPWTLSPRERAGVRGKCACFPLWRGAFSHDDTPAFPTSDYELKNCPTHGITI